MNFSCSYHLSFNLHVAWSKHLSSNTKNPLTGVYGDGMLENSITVGACDNSIPHFIKHLEYL